jgi:hypothetical protein
LGSISSVASVVEAGFSNMASVLENRSPRQLVAG